MTDGLRLTTDFNDPFYSGSAISYDDLSFPISLDDRPFLVDLAADQFSRRSVQLLNTQQSQSGGDTAQVTPEVWRRSQDSWHFGAGQSRYDREESLPYRFNESDGIDPWDKFGVNLLADTTLLRDLSPSSQAIICTIGVKVFIAVGSEVFYYPTVGSPPVTHSSPGTVTHLVSDGENLYTLCSNGDVEKRNSTGTWSTFYTRVGLNSDRALLAAVKGFLILGDENDLIDISSGSATTIFTHPLSSWTWRSACAGQTSIYVLGGAGDRWHLHRISVANTGATLDPPIVAASLPDGEVAYTIAAYLGFVLIGVHYGWRLGTSDANGDVTYGPVVRTPAPVQCFEGQDRFVWFGLSKPDGATNVGGLAPAYAGLGRTDLSVFTNPLVAAYASDLASTGLGTTRSVATVADTTAGLGKRIFSVDGVGVFVESNDLRPSGWVSFGGYNFNSADPKMGLYVQVFHEPLEGGRVGVDMANDLNGGVFTEIGYNTNVGSAATGNIPYARSFNVGELRITLERSTEVPAVGPRVSRSEFRAMNVPGRSTEWRIPIILSESVDSGGAPVGRRITDDYDFLMSLVQTRREFTYREASRSWLLHAVDFLWAPRTLNTTGTTYNGTFTLVARELA